eukprot:SAG22_NODE_13087_length_419_cov_1.168750_1_plen_63_part_10
MQVSQKARIWKDLSQTRTDAKGNPIDPPREKVEAEFFVGQTCGVPRDGFAPTLGEPSLDNIYS